MLLGLERWEGAAASVVGVDAWAFGSTLLIAIGIDVVSWRISGAIRLVIAVLLGDRRGYIVEAAFEGEGVLESLEVSECVFSQNAWVMRPGAGGAERAGTSVAKLEATFVGIGSSGRRPRARRSGVGIAQLGIILLLVGLVLEVA